MNVAKATKAASDRRRLGGPSHAEKEAWQRNLLRARQVLHDDRTWKYATRFRHGLTAVSLERSLVLADESLDEYQAHLARFDRLVRGLETGPLSDPVKLAHGTALAAWRRLRALRIDHEWTLRALVAALHQAIHRHEEASDNVPSLAGGRVGGTDTASSSLASGGDRGSASPDSAVQGGGGGPDVAVKLLGGFLDVASLTRLASDLEEASGDWVRTWPAITRLNNRFDQLWCALVEELGEEPSFLPSSFCWERACMRPSLIVGAYLKWPAEVLGNPLVRPARVVAQMAGREVRLRPLSQWHWHPLFRSLLEAEAHDLHDEVERQAAELDRLEMRRITVSGGPYYRLLAQARRAEEKAEAAGMGLPIGEEAGAEARVPGGAEGGVPVAGLPYPSSPGGPAARQPETRLPLPQTFEEFLELVEKAFGPEPPASAVMSEEQGGDSTTPGPSSTEEGEKEPADDRGRLRRVAELLWQRVERVRLRADQEARELAQLLDAYGDQLGRPGTDVQAAQASAAAEEPTTTPASAAADAINAPTVSPSRGACSAEPWVGQAGAKIGFIPSPVQGLPSSVEKGPAAVGLRPPDQREAIAVRVLRLFRELKAHHVRSAALERTTRLALYDLAVARFGKRQEFDDLKMPSDRFDQLYHEFFDLFFSQFQPRPDGGCG